MEYLITVFHNAKTKKRTLAITELLSEFGFKNTFAKDGQLVKLPESLFIKRTSGISANSIRDKELERIEAALSDLNLDDGDIGVFVGDDWTKHTAV